MFPNISGKTEAKAATYTEVYSNTDTIDDWKKKGSREAIARRKKKNYDIFFSQKGPVLELWHYGISMLGRFGLGGQVWLGMNNSSQTKE